MMHRVGKMPLLENIAEKKPALGVKYDEGESYTWQGRVENINDVKKEYILDIINPIIMKNIDEKLMGDLDKEDHRISNTPKFDDPIQRNKTFNSMYREKGEMWEKFNKINTDLYNTLIENMKLSIVMEKSQADPKYFVPVDHMSNLQTAINEIARKYNLDASNLMIDIWKKLQEHFVEIDS